MKEETKTFMVEDAELVYLNFSGKENPYNKEGYRNFGVIVPEELAQQLADDGWLIKEYKRDLDEGDEPRLFVPVSVRFDRYPPRVILQTEKTRTQLDEDTIGTLDYANMKNVDLIARAHIWGRDGRGGIKAYLQTMFVTIEEDYLEKKYAINENPPN